MVLQEIRLMAGDSSSSLDLIEMVLQAPIKGETGHRQSKLKVTVYP